MENNNEFTSLPETPAPEHQPATEQTEARTAPPENETSQPPHGEPTPPTGSPLPPHGVPPMPNGTPLPPHGAPFYPHRPNVPPHGAPVHPRFTPVNAPAVQMPYMPYMPCAGGVPPFAPPPEKKKKRRVWPFILIGVFAFLVLVTVLVGVALSGDSQDTNRAATLPNTGESYVAVLYIDSEISGDYVTASLYGATSSYDQAFYLDTIDSLIADEANVGIMLYINSPGGEVTATDEFSRAIERYKKETERPVYAYFSDLAASGAYWIGCHADKIIASKFCTTGSIGVTYGTHIEISELLDRLGITVTELTAGDNKAMGSLYSPLTDEQKAMYEDQLEEMHELFIDVVATNRGIDKEKVRQIADGRTFLASKALGYGLIDGIGYYEDAQYTMTVDHFAEENVIFHDCLPKYSPSSNLIYYLRGGDIPEKMTEDADEIAALVEELNRGRRFMALYR